MAEATKVSSKASTLQKQGEFGYPSGHLGHLDASQESALVAFKELCAKHGLYTPAKDGKPPTHDDSVLLRFLRARRFVPTDALGQFKDTEKWRELNQINKLYYNIDVDNYDEARRLYPQWTGRRDKRGIPVYLFMVKPLDSKAMAAYAKSSAQTTIAAAEDVPAASAAAARSTKANAKPVAASGETPPRLLRLFALYENLAGFMVELCSRLRDRPHPDTPITQSNNIVDISGVGLKQFWNLRGHMQDASVLATAHYPETLDRIFIVGAPSFFPTVWSWIKRWFDPITVSKIFILSQHDALPTLATFIDPANIPKRYGGTLDYDFGQLPAIDPAYADRIEWKTPAPASGPRRWPDGPAIWQKREDGDLDLVLVGSKAGKPRRETVATLRLEEPSKRVSFEMPANAAAPGAEEKAATEMTTATREGELAKEGKIPSDPVAAAGPSEPATQKAVPDAPPVEQKVEPVPLDAIATELPKETPGDATTKPATVPNGSI